jgi:hypothetical protein
VCMSNNNVISENFDFGSIQDKKLKIIYESLPNKSNNFN